MISIPTMHEFLSAKPQKRELLTRRKHYDPATEKPPDSQYFKLSKSVIDTKRTAILNEIIPILKRTSSDEELMDLQKTLPELKDVPKIIERLIAIVGYQGMGKSSLINSLLHRPDLAATSAEGEACTSFVTIYRYRPGTDDNDKVSDVEVKYLSPEYRRHLLVRLIRDYYVFWFRIDDNEEYTGEQETRAANALEILRLVFNTANEAEAETKLNGLLTAESIESGTLLEESLRMVEERIDEAGADEQGIKHSWDVNDRHIPMKRAEAAELWPFVEYMNIYTGGSLLRNGLAFADVPGFGDWNQTRTSVVYKFRRTADYEFIVTEPSRVATYQPLLQLLEESIGAHGPQNTFLIINRIDDIVGDNQIYKEINFPKDNTFKAIQRRWHEDLEEEEKGDDETTEVMHKAYRKHLLTLAQTAYIDRREQKSTAELHKHLKSPEPIKIFSVSANKYNALLEPLAEKDWSPEMTRIPTLRRFALDLTSNANLENYHNNCFVTMPGLMDKIGRILDKYPDEDGYAQSRQVVKHQVSKLENTMEDEFVSLLMDKLPSPWPKLSFKAKQLDELIKVVEWWGVWLPWQTFDKVMRDNGIPIGSKCKNFEGMRHVNMNMDLSKKTCVFLNPWKTRVSEIASEFASNLVDAMDLVLEQVSPSIKMLTGNPSLKDLAIAAWEKEKNNIAAKAAQLDQKLSDATEASHKSITTETDSMCMIAKLNAENYLAASKVLRGPGLHRRQEGLFISGLSDKDANGQSFMDKLEDQTMQRMRSDLQTTFEAFKADILDSFRGFIKVMEDFLISVSELTAEDLRIREELEAVFPKVQAMVKELQNLFEDPKEQDERDEVSLITSKRLKIG